ncbi:MAG TPA: protein kinase, partial [Candidatus Angelobacter sp.]|nr:protein kinase [Candidatus Angelobacter sp.]
MPLATGSRLGPYEILAPLGAGGMGEVYRAHDSRLNRTVAIKILPASFASDHDRLQRFAQEARSAAALNHPNILSIFDIGEEGGNPYVVSELLEGETLRARLSKAPIPLRKALNYALQVAHGLAAAHEKGIIHRDLKPENLF